MESSQNQTLPALRCFPYLSLLFLSLSSLRVVLILLVLSSLFPYVPPHHCLRSVILNVQSYPSGRISSVLVFSFDAFPLRLLCPPLSHCLSFTTCTQAMSLALLPSHTHILIRMHMSSQAIFSAMMRGCICRPGENLGTVTVRDRTW